MRSFRENSKGKRNMTNKANLTELNQPERKQKPHLKAKTKVSPSSRC